MPKNNNPSGFMLFVFKRKKEMGSEAKNWSTCEAVEKIAPEWERLSKDEQFPFKERAKAMKGENRKKGIVDINRNVTKTPSEQNEAGECTPGEQNPPIPVSKPRQRVHFQL